MSPAHTDRTTFGPSRLRDEGDRVREELRRKRTGDADHREPAVRELGVLWRVGARAEIGCECGVVGVGVV